jgi:photosystem II stability/assembly factor-like uncharacterized protein
LHGPGRPFGGDGRGGSPVQRYDITQALASNGKVVVAGTQSGAVLVSADNGRSWKREMLGEFLIGIATCPDGRFVAVDFFRKVWSSDAAGAGWKAVHRQAAHALAITCDAKGRWWVAGTGATLAVSADAGATWTVTDLAEDAQLTGIQMVDETVGFATGEFGLVAVTPMAAPPGHASRRCPTSSIPTRPCSPPCTGWASGIAGQILHTSDGGQTWTRQTNASRASLYRLFMHEGVPHGVGAGGVVARLEGDTWRTVPYPDAAPVFLGAGVPARTARHHRWRPGWPAARDRHPGRPGFLRITGPAAH